MSDLALYFDPVCPFAWLTSRWVRSVQLRRGYAVEWRFLSLRMLNADRDYATEFPPDYENYHGAGLRLLRVAAAVREQHGPELVGRFYDEVGESFFGRPGSRATAAVRAHEGAAAFARRAIATLGLATALADALDDPARDRLIRDETDAAVALAGPDLGAPVLHFGPPDGPALFGPVLSSVPAGDAATALWDHVAALAAVSGFAELKRSLRDMPQVPAYSGTELLDHHTAGDAR